jgi:hypothetical protein
MNNLYSVASSKCCIALIIVFAVLFQTLPLPVNAQTTPPQGGCQECVTDSQHTWSQNANITVNLNANQFSEADRQCIQGLIDELNSQSSALGNASGVKFNLTRSTTSYVSLEIDANGDGSINANGNSNVLQINRPPLSDYNTTGFAPSPLDITTDFGATAFAPSSGLNATAAITFLNPNISSCEALRFNILHEIAHTLGLDDCESYNPPADQSVMFRPTCLNLTSGCTPQDFNFVPSDARTNLSDCDNQKIKEAGTYNPNLVNQQVGGGGGDPPQNPNYPTCTPYYWVYYLSWDLGQSWEVVDVQYAGCW